MGRWGGMINSKNDVTFECKDVPIDEYYIGTGPALSFEDNTANSTYVKVEPRKICEVEIVHREREHR